MGGDVREVLKHPVEGVHYVELDPLVVEAARRYLPPNDRRALDDPRLHLAYTDGRLYVKESNQTFDLIIVDLPEPATGQLNRFYTQEFFWEVHDILREGGILSFGLPSADNYWSPELARRNGSIYHTLHSVFADVLVLPGAHNFFLASDSPFPSDPALLAHRLEERGIENHWVTAPYIDYIFTTDRLPLVRQSLEAARSKVNRDLVPICYYYDLVLWLSLFYPSLRGALERAPLFNLGWLFVPWALIVIFARWRKGSIVPAVIAFTGFVQMALEVVLLFAFQVLHGYVYHEVSLIVTAFMAGLVLGSTAANRLLKFSQMGEDGFRKALIILQLVTAVYAISIPLVLRGPLPHPDISFPGLTLLAGLFGGTAFPLAVALSKGSVERVAGAIYGADLVGGCLGAFLMSGFFIPILGIPQACYGAALLALAGAALLI